MKYKGKQLDSVMIAMLGEFVDPYKSVVEVYLEGPGWALNEVEILAFIEENYPLLSSMCAEANEAWSMEHKDNVTRIH